MLEVGFQKRGEPMDEAARFLWQKKKELLFTKNDDFRDEAEYRFLTVDTGQSEIQAPEIELQRICRVVVVADKFPEVYLPSLKTLGAGLGITASRYHFSGDIWFLGKM